MADIDRAFTVDSGISLDDVVGIFGGDNDPRSGEVAPLGSLFIRSTGQLFQKFGVQDVEWQLIGDQSNKQLIGQHNGVITQTISTTYATILFNSILRTDPSVTYAAGDFTIVEPGDYVVVVDCSAGGTSNTRTSGEWRMTINGVEIPGTLGYTYHRNINNGNSSLSMRTIVTLDVGDVLNVQGRASANTIATLANGSRFFMEKV